MTSGLLERSHSKTKHQIALIAVEAAYLIAGPPWIWEPKLPKPILCWDGEGAHLRAPAASTDENQIIPERGTWCRHNIQKIHSPVLPPPPPHAHSPALQIFTDTVTPLFSFPPLGQPRSRRVRPSRRKKEEKKSLPSFPFTRKEENPPDIMRLSKL